MRYSRKGFDGAHFIAGLSEHFRNLLVGKDQSTLKLLEVSEGIKAKYLQQSQAASVSFLLSAMNIANQCDINYKLSKNQRLQVELALLKMCHLPSVFNDVPVMSEAPMAYTADRTPPPTAKPEPVKASPPAATASAPLPKIAIPTRSTLTPSLSNLNSTDTATLEEEDPYEKGTDKEAFSSHDLVNYWNEYAAKAKEEGKATLSTIFAGKPVMLNPVLYEVTVETKFQENALRDEKPALLNFLRSKLKNFDLDIITRFDEIAAKRKPYGSKEIFMHMAAKNPQILELKNKLNLELD
jgi:DNA polymerase-3 subunit gamma/tau